MNHKVRMWSKLKSMEEQQTKQKTLLKEAIRQLKKKYGVETLKEAHERIEGLRKERERLKSDLRSIETAMEELNIGRAV